jgi:hypothetical protein
LAARGIGSNQSATIIYGANRFHMVKPRRIEIHSHKHIAVYLILPTLVLSTFFFTAFDVMAYIIQGYTENPRGFGSDIVYLFLFHIPNTQRSMDQFFNRR